MRRFAAVPLVALFAIALTAQTALADSPHFLFANASPRAMLGPWTTPSSGLAWLGWTKQQEMRFGGRLSRTSPTATRWPSGFCANVPTGWPT
jgi:hypothetical protein